MIFLFHSTIVQRYCHFVEEFFNFEPRRINNDQSLCLSKEEKRGKKETNQEQEGWY